MIKTLFEKIKITAELVKFEHTIFALPFAFMGALMGAEGPVPFDRIFYILLAMIGARTAAMAFNRIADRRIDAKNPRTQNRALPKKLLSLPAVWSLITLSLSIFFYAAYNLNMVCLKLAPLALFLMFFYSWTKRFTSFSHFVLGLVLAIAPMGGYLAVRPVMNWAPLILSAAVLLWSAGFDIIYACQDIEFDKTEKLHSLPVICGMQNALYISRTLHAFTVAVFFLTGYLISADFFYYTS
ncbi:MAG TPA: UbiA-like polyprenyltransferase, partial [Candidatus Wallbacteria bacterium]|nr:UbiA-like polyprenyltransferase [Candidatus Wallbacteria bacterium]